MRKLRGDCKDWGGGHREDAVVARGLDHMRHIVVCRRRRPRSEAICGDRAKSGPRLKDTPVRFLSAPDTYLWALYLIQQGTQSSTPNASQMGYLLVEVPGFWAFLQFCGWEMHDSLYKTN